MPLRYIHMYMYVCYVLNVTRQFMMPKIDCNRIMFERIKLISEIA